MWKNIEKWLITSKLRYTFFSFPLLISLLSFHLARHTFACLAVEYGMPIDVLAKILGHSNTNMTRHYAKFSEQLIGREMRKMNERMFSGYVLSLNQ